MGKSQDKTKRSKSDKIVIAVGIGVIALAAVIALLAYFVPQWQRQGDMEDRLEQVLSAEVESAVLIDLLPDGGDLLYDAAVQVELNEETLTQVRQGIAQWLDDGFSYTGNGTQPALTDLSLRIRATDGSFAQIYFGAETFYFYENGQTTLFSPDDAEAYHAFYQALTALVATK